MLFHPNLSFHNLRWHRFRHRISNPTDQTFSWLQTLLDIAIVVSSTEKAMSEKFKCYNEFSDRLMIKDHTLPDSGSLPRGGMPYPPPHMMMHPGTVNRLR